MLCCPTQLLGQIKDQKRLEAYYYRVSPSSEESKKIRFKLQMLVRMLCVYFGIILPVIDNVL